MDDEHSALAASSNAQTNNVSDCDDDDKQMQEPQQQQPQYQQYFNTNLIFSASNNLQYDEYVRMAVQYSFENNFLTAQSYFHRAIELEPYNWRAFFHRGNEYFNVQRYHSAEQDLNFALHKCTNLPSAYIHVVKGCLLEIEKKNEEARVEYGKALAIEPNNYYANIYTGLTYMTASKYEDSLKYFLAAEHYSHFSPCGIIAKIGVVYMKLKQYEKAESYFLRAIAINSKYITAITSLGQRYHTYLNKPQKAIELFNKYLSQPQTMYEVNLHLASTYTLMNEMNKAHSHLDKATMLNKYSHTTYSVLFYSMLNRTITLALQYHQSSSKLSMHPSNEQYQRESSENLTELQASITHVCEFIQYGLENVLSDAGIQLMQKVKIECVTRLGSLKKLPGMEALLLPKSADLNDPAMKKTENKYKSQFKAAMYKHWQLANNSLHYYDLSNYQYYNSTAYSNGLNKAVEFVDTVIVTHNGSQKRLVK